MSPLRCVFCGARLEAARCVWVRLPDGGEFVCCPSVCPPLLDALECVRQARAAESQQLSLPLVAAS